MVPNVFALFGIFLTIQLANAEDINDCLKNVHFTVNDYGALQYADEGKSCIRSCIFNQKFPDPQRNPAAFAKTPAFKQPLIQNCSETFGNILDDCERGRKLEQCYVAGIGQLNADIYMRCLNTTGNQNLPYKYDMYCQNRCVDIESNYFNEDNTLVFEPESKSLREEIRFIYKENNQRDVCLQAHARKYLIEKLTKGTMNSIYQAY